MCGVVQKNYSLFHSWFRYSLLHSVLDFCRDVHGGVASFKSQYAYHQPNVLLLLLVPALVTIANIPPWRWRVVAEAETVLIRLFVDKRLLWGSLYLGPIPGQTILVFYYYISSSLSLYEHFDKAAKLVEKRVLMYRISCARISVDLCLYVSKMVDIRLLVSCLQIIYMICDLYNI